MPTQQGADFVAIADKPDPTRSTGEVMKQLSEEQREILRELRRLREELKQREQDSRSFMRSILDGIKQGANQTFIAWQKLFKD